MQARPVYLGVSVEGLVVRTFRFSAGRTGASVNVARRSCISMTVSSAEIDSMFSLCASVVVVPFVSPFVSVGRGRLSPFALSSSSNFRRNSSDKGVG